eukprot:7927871-Pyramimonas_sp.AAC.1
MRRRARSRGGFCVARNRNVAVLVCELKRTFSMAVADWVSQLKCGLYVFFYRFSLQCAGARGGFCIVRDGKVHARGHCT